MPPGSAERLPQALQRVAILGEDDRGLLHAAQQPRHESKLRLIVSGLVSGLNDRGQPVPLARCVRQTGRPESRRELLVFERLLVAERQWKLFFC